ncbi:uncharacterized protein LOC127804449 [Diospyros lotus]|uniref:uncharacterized protein LOC127804449 n=1 Tax=Diospyros lotus TaxID=55363 RepID=UPI0022529704|nr:uncharacterized protein LOC127804449 [Diospyros lotus]
MAPYEALYGRKCRSHVHWNEVGERKILGPEIVEQTIQAIERIKDSMKKAQNRQKNYVDKRRRDLEFSIGDKVFLKVTPIKEVLRFGKKGKLRPRFIGPFEILKRVGNVAYQLALPPELSAVHDIFHISMLRNYIPDPTHVIKHQALEIQQDLKYEEAPISIVTREVQRLRNKDIPLVKVLWQHHSVEEATWEREDDMRSKYPQLFDDEK